VMPATHSHFGNGLTFAFRTSRIRSGRRFGHIYDIATTRPQVKLCRTGHIAWSRPRREIGALVEKGFLSLLHLTFGPQFRSLQIAPCRRIGFPFAFESRIEACRCSIDCISRTYRISKMF